MRIGGKGMVRDCSFLSNSVSTRGLAIAAVVQTVNVSRSSFDRNRVTCASGSYRRDAKEVSWNYRRKPVNPAREHVSKDLLTFFRHTCIFSASGRTMAHVYPLTLRPASGYGCCA